MKRSRLTDNTQLIVVRLFNFVLTSTYGGKKLYQ